MFNLPQGSNDPKIVHHRQRFNKAYQVAFCLIALVALIPESALANSRLASTISSLVGFIVPAIQQMASIAATPAKVALVYSLVWLMIPFWYLMSCRSLPFWQEEIFRATAKRVMKLGWFRGLILVPVVFSQFILTDFGVIKGFGVFNIPIASGPGNWGFIGVAHSYSLGIALYYMSMGLLETLMYFYMSALIFGTALHFVRKIHLMPKHT